MAGGKPTRIDHVLANRGGAAVVRKAWIDWETEIHTHGALCLDIHIGKPRLGLILRTPTKWEPKLENKPDEATHRAKWDSRNPEGANTWGVLNEHAVLWAREHAGEQKGGKGGKTDTRKSPYPEAHGNGGEVLVGEAKLIAATRRRLEALVRAFRQDGEPCINALRKKLRNTCAGAWENDLQIGDIQKTGESAVRFAKIEKEHVWRLRERRRIKWRKKIQEWYTGSGSKLYAWVKSKSKWNSTLEHVAAGADKDGGRDNQGAKNCDHFGDPVEIQARLETAWRRVWQEQKTRGDNWETMMGTLNTMPDFPERVGWTGATVGNTLKRMARNKAPGLDEWRVYEMRAWPKHLHEAAAEILNEVEQTGKWPADLGGAPRDSTGKGGDVGPYG